jgi:hypothetical protein
MMAKYYVETGNLQVVVDANEPFSACTKALVMRAEADDLFVNSNKTLALSDQFTVNETGFPSNREPYAIHSGEHLVSTEEVLSYFRRRS